MLHDSSIKQPELVSGRMKKVLLSSLPAPVKGRSFLTFVLNVAGSVTLLQRAAVVLCHSTKQEWTMTGVTMKDNLSVHGPPSIRYGRKNVPSLRFGILVRILVVSA
jgi:hypothetical protein